MVYLYPPQNTDGGRDDLAYGLGVWLKLASEPTISLAIAASYLGPYSVDRVFGALADRYARAKQPAQPQEA